VIIVHGDNGYGKTSLFRAISWCLFGKQRGRGLDAVSLFNQTARKEGQTRCSAKVVFEDSGRTYTATRWYDRTVPNGSERFSLEQFSAVDGKGNAISDDTFRELLGRIFPYEVSKLFLFDGEELQTYENLVDADKEQQNAELRSRLEMVLGVPALQDARSIAETACEDLKKAYQGAVQDATTDAGARDELGQLQTRIKAKEDDITECTRSRDSEQAEVDRLRRALLTLDGVAKLVREELALQQQVSVLTEQVHTGRQQRSGVSGPLYIEVLRPTLNEVVGHLRKNDRDARQGQIDSLKLLGRQDLLSEILADGQCVCSTKLDAPKRVFVETRLQGVRDDSRKVPEAIRQPAAWGWIADQLDGILAQDYWADYHKAEGDVSGLIVRRAELTGKIQAIEATLRGGSTEEVRSLSEQLAAHSASLAGLEKELQAHHQALTDLKGQQKSLEARALRGSAKAEAAKVEERRLKVAQEAASTFEHAIDELRQIKRTDVQNAASEAFLAMRWKKDFTGLKINKGYGLIIQLGGDEDIPARSAGEAQIVALALISGLNKCANIRAPIIMDTPFSRLDPEHRRLVLQYLAKMGEQIVLLATSAEVSDSDANAIRGDIASEWHIKFIRHGKSEIRG
jgi:DNA sulfur modification protein DndD